MHIKYVSPAFLLIVFAGFCVKDLPGYVRGLAEKPVARWTVLLLVGILALAIQMDRCIGVVSKCYNVEYDWRRQTKFEYTDQWQEGIGQSC